MADLDKKMVKYAKIVHRINRLNYIKISEKKYMEEYPKHLNEFKNLSSEIMKDIQDKMDELEKIKVFFRIVSSYDEP